FELLLVRELLQLLFQAFLVAAKADEAAHAGFFVLGTSGFKLLDQTGQGVADFASEDHRDRTSAEPSDLANFFARTRAVAIQRMERAGYPAPDVGTRLEIIRRHRTAANQQRDREGCSHSESRFHGRTYLLVVERNSGPLYPNRCTRVRRHGTGGDSKLFKL